jgi:hypothetical protein
MVKLASATPIPSISMQKKHEKLSKSLPQTKMGTEPPHPLRCHGTNRRGNLSF